MCIALACAALLPRDARAQTDWPTFGGGPQHTGYNATETTLSVQNASSLATIWTHDLGGPIWMQPTFLSNVRTSRGGFDVVYAGTLYGDMYALYAATGAVLWHRTLGAYQNTCDDFSVSGNIIGVLDTATIDRAHNRLFVVDGTGFLHALDIATGAEQAGYPLQVVDPPDAGQIFSYGSPTYDAKTGFLYISLAGACDQPPYHGEVVQVAANTPSVANRWYSTGVDGPSGGGVWGPGGVSLSPDGTAIYALTGNALADPEDPPYADYLVKLNQSLTVVAADGPPIAGTDEDFGATPLMFQPTGCPPLLAAMNKSGALFVYNASSNATIGAGPLQRIQVAGQEYSSMGSFIGIPAYDPVLQRVFLGNPSDGTYAHGLLAFNVTAACTLSLAWEKQVGLDNVPFDNPMIPPVVANGVVYYADGDASQVFAFNELTGQQIWNSGTLIAGGIFAAPTVANGHLFVSGSYTNTLYAFGPGGTKLPNNPSPQYDSHGNAIVQSAATAATAAAPPAVMPAAPLAPPVAQVVAPAAPQAPPRAPLVVAPKAPKAPASPG